MVSTTQRYIVVDLNSIVTLDSHIFKCRYAKPSVTPKLLPDRQAQETIRYAIKAGHYLPIYVGQVAPLYYTESFEFMRAFGACKYITSLCDFNIVSSPKLKYLTAQKYETADYAYDKQKEDLPIWESFGMEVLN